MIKTHKLSSMMALISLLCLLTALPGQAASGSDIWLEFFTHGDIDRALSAFEESVSESSGDALAHAGLAMLAPSRQTDIDVVEHYFLALENGLDTPQAAYYLEEIQRKISGQEEYAEAVKRYERMLKGNELNTFLRDSIQFYRAKLLQKLGRWEEAEAAFNQLNFITSFWYCGVFDNAEKGGHEQTFGPEENLDLSVAYKGKRGQVNWRPIPLQPYDGYIDLHGFAAPSKEASTYLVTQLNSSQNQQCTLKLGHAGAVKGWLNGEPVLDVARYHPVRPDQVDVDITLQKGNNILLLKISSSETGKYGFSLRTVPQDDGFITVDNLKGNEDLTASTPQSSQLPDSDVLIEPKPFQQLKALADAPEARPYHLLFYALLLQRLHVADETDTSANNMLSKLNEAIPNNPLILRYLGDSEKQKNRKRLAYTQALEADPKDQACFLRLLKYYRTSPYATKLPQLIKEWGKTNKIPAAARLSQAQFLSRQGMREAAIDLIRAVMEDEESFEAKNKLYDIGKAVFAEQQRKDLLHQLMKENAADTNRVHEMRRFALREGDRETVEEMLRLEKRIRPYSISGLVDMAKYDQVRGEYARSLGYLDRAFQTAPDDFECHRLAAVAHKALGETDEALKELGLALKIQPSDPWCLQYQEFLKPDEENYATPYKRNWQEIEIPQGMDLSQANYLNILDHRVVKVHQNGNSSETVHLAAKILTDNGLQQKQVHGIYYEGDTETVRILKARVWKPDGTFYDAPAAEKRSTASAQDAASKLYGDYKVAIVRFPALEKGAVVELEYEKEQKGENIYADYFGDLFYAGDPRFEPTVLAEYVLITPTARDFYYKYIGPNYPAAVSKEMTELNGEPELKESDSEKVFHWLFRNMPTVPREPYMPHAAEILPYVKVSTFETWQDMTDWYWNLMREQIIPGQPVKERLQQVLSEYRQEKGYEPDRELTDWEKVRAINEYVNTGVRYLGLEFGIHGYKPHKVDAICNARYGDCKDKAALAMSMLREVGIETYFVIIRTTHLGEIDYELPSLGIFNHAIYYLPDIDGKEYWIDGTATFFDVTELPPGDEGANTLIVKPGGDYMFKRVPHSPARSNGGVFTTVLTLGEDGDAEGYRAAEFRGLYNPMVRRTYENKAKARELVDRILVGNYPGSKTANVELSDLEDYSTSERLAYELTISQFGMKSGEELIVPTVVFPEDLSKRYAHLSERKFDLVLNYAWNQNNRLKLTLGERLGAARLPKEQSIQTEFGEYSRTCTQTDGVLEIKEDIVFHAIRVPKEKYKDFREFCRLVDLYQNEKITVKIEG